MDIDILFRYVKTKNHAEIVYTKAFVNVSPILVTMQTMYDIVYILSILTCDH